MSTTPRALKTMAVIRWILLGLVTLVAGFTVWTYWGPGSDVHAESRPDHYYCPMHPQIRSPDPGECPICHMDLEPIPMERKGSDAPSAPAPPGLAAVPLTLERQQLIGVATSPVERRSPSRILRLPAAVELPEDARSEVHVRAAGFLETLDVAASGVSVTRGQVLAHIYSPAIVQAQAELLASARFGSEAGDLVKGGRQALALLGVAPGDVDAMLKKGEALRIVPLRAPRAGVVTRLGAVLGAYVQPETVLYELTDLSRLWVVAQVQPADLQALDIGSGALVARYLPAGSAADQALATTVVLIEPALDPEARTARLRLSLPNPDGRRRPGEIGEVRIEFAAQPGLFVPDDALVDTGLHQYVFVAIPDGPDTRFEPRSVRGGRTFDDAIEILDGLREGERVVTHGGFMIDSESRIRAAQRAAPAAPAMPDMPAPPATEPR